MLLLKVDFNKAFYPIKWGYLDSVMAQIGFGIKWRSSISECISSSSASVLFNDIPKKEYHMSKGVRQGDPLSPFLLIIQWKVMYIALMEAYGKGLIHGIKISGVILV